MNRDTINSKNAAPIIAPVAAKYPAASRWPRSLRYAVIAESEAATTAAEISTVMCNPVATANVSHAVGRTKKQKIQRATVCVTRTEANVFVPSDQAARGTARVLASALGRRLH